MRQRKYIAYDWEEGDKIAEETSYDLLLNKVIDYLVNTGLYSDNLKIYVCSKSPPDRVENKAILDMAGCTKMPGWEYDLINQLVKKLSKRMIE